MKQWLFDYHWGNTSPMMPRRTKPFISHAFYPYTLSEWLYARGDPKKLDTRFHQRLVQRPKRK